MKLAVQYLKERWRGILAIFFCFLIFLISFALYHLPLKAVIYPFLLCILLGSIVLILDVRRVKCRHEVLNSIQSITDAVTDSLPKPESIEDEDYQKIIGLITQEHNEYRTHAHEKYANMIDYYTVWVHQIKTPIASMKLHLQNEDTSLSRKLAADLFRIEQYVEMVLAFLRLNSDSTDYVIAEHDLDTIIRQAVKGFAGEFIERKLCLEYEPFATTVITDEKWFSFVLEQILSNALKYTPSGTISITLESGKRLCIRDTGIGIAAEDLPRIFENGFTGYNGRTDKKASGIGLYLCRRICENLGHKIEVSSQIDKGTCVSICLEQRKLNVE